MEIPANILRCVAFVAGKTPEGQHKFAGTCFLVTRLIPELPGRHFTYAVTARHVIDQVFSLLKSDAVHLRINFRDGDARFVETPITAWVPHPEASVDLSIARFQEGPSMQIERIALESMMTAEGVDKEQIGSGDDLFFPGLFVRHSGEKRNVPILRAGSIAAMRAEKVLIKGHYCDVYLVEGRSIGGLSGSPVFVHIGGGVRGGRVNITRLYLMGVLSGHWDESTSSEDAPSYELSPGETVNMGIGFVVPAEKIVETIDQPEFRDIERRWIELLLLETKRTEDHQLVRQSIWKRWFGLR